MKTSRGYTLIEVVVAGAVTVFLVFIFFDIVILARKYLTIIDVKAEVQVNVKLGMDKVLMEAENSKFTTFTINNNLPKAVSFLSAYDSDGIYRTDSYGRPVWQKYVVFYLTANSSNLLRKEIDSPGATSALTQSELISYCDGGGTVAAFDVSDFQLELDNTLKKVSIRLDTDKIYAGRENTSYLVGNLFF